MKDTRPKLARTAPPPGHYHQPRSPGACLRRSQPVPSPTRWLPLLVTPLHLAPLWNAGQRETPAGVLTH